MSMTDLQFGDLVFYDTHFYDQGKEFRMHARIMGLLTPQASLAATHSMSDKRFLLRTFVPIPHDKDAIQAIDWSVRGAHEDVIEQWQNNRLDLEWGNLPKKNEQFYWIGRSADNIFASVDSYDSSFFKLGGACPRCGHNGKWISLGLMCPFHGRFAG